MHGDPLEPPKKAKAKAKGTKMNRKVIRVPDWDAAEMEDLLTVGSDAGGLGQNDYTIEKIGEPFTDDEGRKVVEITLVERTKQ